MSNRTKIYWLVTGIFCLALTLGGLGNLVRFPAQVEIIESLGFPVFLTTILGTAKLLGVAALLAPGRPILKEWAYAGFTFDLLGASVSHTFVGHPIPQILIPLVLLGLAATSYMLRPDSRRVSEAATGASG